MNRINDAAHELSRGMGARLNQIRLDYEIRNRADGPFLVFLVAAPHERLFRALREAQSDLDEEHPFKARAIIAKRRQATADRISLPETQLLRTTISESLTVDRHTFENDFFERYIRSVFNYEDQIVSDGNFIVYGRRGSGKSSLLAYAMHHRQQQEKPLAWLNLQSYAGRGDIHVSTDAFSQVLDQLLTFSPSHKQYTSLLGATQQLASAEDADATKALERLIPSIGRALADIAKHHGSVSIFLDDLHSIRADYQAVFLKHIYGAARGNKCFLKISSIEQFSRLWEPSTRHGLEIPHDAQALKLDYNLTMPDKSKTHITSILDAHARFCGLPAISHIANDQVLSRLVWVAAAVPRDALNLFSQSIVRASSAGAKRITVTAVNSAASETATQKLKDIELDGQSRSQEARKVLDLVKDFCISKRKTNAFLLEIQNDSSVFQRVQDLIALRLVHVLHEGITPHQAGRRYQALLLDYGFYVGMRAARSVDLFSKEAKRPQTQELRKLPIFNTT